MRTRGVAGAGFVGPVYIKAVRQLEHRVVGLLGSAPGKGRAAADALTGPAVEGVPSATPNRLHFDPCTAFRTFPVDRQPATGLEQSCRSVL